MTWGMVAVGVGTVAAGAMSSRAAGKAADKASEGAGAARQDVLNASMLGRQDLQRIYPQAQGDLISGASGAADVLGQGITEQQRLLSEGNLGAQGTLGRGFGNIQAALLGTPINQQDWAPQGPQLSQAPANPFGQTLGGGQVQGGIFSNMGENVQANKIDETRVKNQGRFAEMAMAGDMGAELKLAQGGFNIRGEPISKQSADIKVARIEREMQAEKDQEAARSQALKSWRGR